MKKSAPENVSAPDGFCRGEGGTPPGAGVTTRWPRLQANGIVASWFRLTARFQKFLRELPRLSIGTQTWSGVRQACRTPSKIKEL